MKLCARIAPLLLLATLLVPAMAHADASVIQTWCYSPDHQPNIVEVYFQVVNFSLPEPICGLSLRSEPFPPDPSCEPRWLAVTPKGWQGQLNGLGGADWWLLDGGECIENEAMSGEFTIVLPDPDDTFCCYVVDFLNADGEVMLTQEECFFCSSVPTENTSWSTVKSLYQ